MALGLDEIAPFSSGWSLGIDGYELLRADLATLAPRALVEYGAGVSTLHLSQDFSDAAIFSHESHAEFAEDTRAKVSRLGASDRVHVTTSPLAWQFFGGAFFLSYSRSVLPPEADAILVDGPPYWTRRGREACLYHAHGVLRVGGRVYLDDYRRPNERRTVENWYAAFPGAFRRVGVLPSEHEICVLEKVAPTELPRMDPRHVIDASYQAFRYGISKLRGHIPS